MIKYGLLDSDLNIKETIERDTINRNQKLVNLAKLINVIDTNYIISIDGNWGCGKTFFVKQLVYLIHHFQELDKFKKDKIIEELSSKYLVVYYNAWNNDNHEEPIESLIFNILNEYPQIKKKQDKEDVKSSSIQSVIKNLAKILTKGIISEDTFKKASTFEDIAKGVFTSEEKKEALNNIINTLLDDQQRLLLIVDELDRCKPDFAVRMLETLKNFYNNYKITTIVSTNNNELAHTIKHFYGKDYNGYKYLNRIYDTIITLETENLEDYLQKNFEIWDEEFSGTNIYLLSDFFKFTFREINQFLTDLKLAENYISNVSKFLLIESALFVPMALALKINDIKQYNRFIIGEGADILEKFLNYSKNTKYYDSSYYLNWIMNILKVSNHEDAIKQLMERYEFLFNPNRINNIHYNNYPFLEAISMLGNRIKF